MKNILKQSIIILVTLVVGIGATTLYFTHKNTCCNFCGEPYNIESQFYKNGICDICNGYIDCMDRYDINK